MKLTVVAPTDLSLGSISVAKAGVDTANHRVTPERREFETANAQPGVYTALIEPLGMRPRTYVFNLDGSQESTRVSIPPISYLGLGQQISEDLREALIRENATRTQVTPVPIDKHPSSPPQVGVAADRPLTLGFSEDRTAFKHGGWRPYRRSGQISAELLDDRVELLVPVQTPAVSATSGRLRVSLLVGGSREEHALVPLYPEGTKIIVQASSLTTLDAEWMIVPVNPLLRALTQCLRTGTEADARAIGGEYWKSARAREDEPWSAILVALLSARYPSVFPARKSSLPPSLLENYPWISDLNVLNAREQLRRPERGSIGIRKAAGAALDSLAKAAGPGPTYFSYSLQIANELLASLAAMDLDKSATTFLREIRAAWSVENVRLMNAGASLSWVNKPKAAKRTRLSTAQLSGQEAIAGDAHQRVSDAPSKLNRRQVAIVFEGTLKPGQVTGAAPSAKPARTRSAPAGNSKKVAASSNSAASASQESPAIPDDRLKRASSARAAVKKPAAKRAAPLQPPAAEDPPALSRPIRKSTDPQKGRFGKESQAGGFRLDARFQWNKGDKWVNITLEVVSLSDLQPNFDRPVEFFLHNSYNPDRIRAVFRGDRAGIDLWAWGGFTVGAWLPNEKVELELDLSKVPGAPKPIRKY